MPKGRGANARRSKYQKDNQDRLDAGASKLVALHRRWVKLVEARRKQRNG